MPFSKAAISSVRVAMLSFAVAMACSESETARSMPFFLSSARSSWVVQYSFLWMSSSCSFFRTATMLSIILMTLSKPPRFKDFLPASVRAIRSMPVRSMWPAAVRATRMAVIAWVRKAVALVRTCTKLALALGRVFLNSSSASSSLRTLMVSASATSSSARTFLRSSHSAVFVLQLSSRLPRNSWSLASAAWVSDRSSFICTICTPNSPMATVFVSMEAVSALTSFVFAAISSP
mmetsp:Transcript_55652/g.165486  ORF Transcript_55652/g.165486 Transcript_55652/m.165486 type:complete len:234 (+) Transcript_55652:832-1533(+)